MICYYSPAKSSLQCGQTSRFKRTVIRSPSQSLSTSSCQYTFRRYSNNVCQLLVQFQRFELPQPTADSITNTLTCKDSFTAGRFTLCGDNTGQHIYLPFTADATVLDFNILSRSTQTAWHLIVEQLECPPSHSHLADGLPPLIGGVVNNLLDWRNLFSRFINDLELLAPAGCDQYYTKPEGVISSFNFRDGINTYYMSNLKYTICIKAATGAKDIEYTVKKFSLSFELPNEYYNDACRPPIATEGRQSDYLMLPNSNFADNTARQPTYFCGQGLAAGQVLLGSGPFVLYFSSDEQWSLIETGFSIEYRIKALS
ncbi:PREDICTED: uncharacterized protein LOC108376931 [Rhagoletis zephyria]|uniref:uncharacterized protein LOC108376931 n=1 Tax=Rhagoletis zephyria TaxID=28612 RepID=UPI0008113A11|nr:PREDICTED: uncharacterized protein LOC108376931 [Rhagoletis zephyria]